MREFPYFSVSLPLLRAGAGDQDRFMSVRIQHERSVLRSKPQRASRPAEDRLLPQRVQYERRLLPHGRKREAGDPEGRILPVRLLHQRELLSTEPLIYRANQEEGKDAA